MSVPRPDHDPALVLEHAPYVRALAQALVFDRHLARDLEQDVLLAALENSPRDPRSLKGWLAALVRNLASKAQRSRARRVERETRAARPEDAVPTPQEILAREDLRRWLLEHLLALDEPVRAVMILRFTEELPPREVARRLKIPVETVRTRVKRGLEELRARLDRQPRRGNGLWCLALVQGLKIEPPSVVGAGFKLVGAALPGVLALSTAKKAIAAALVVALATTVYLVGWKLEPSHPPVSVQAPVPAPERTELSPQEGAARVAESEGRSALAAEPQQAPAAPATSGSVLLKLHWHDGTPAEGVVARVYCGGAEDFYADTLDVTTGADGTKLCENLPPGRVTAYLDRGPAEGCKVAAGEQGVIEITIPRGYDIAGEVVERSGRPVAGARILLDHMGNGWNCYDVSRTDSEGRFRIRSLESSLFWITARAPLHAPSPQVQVIGGTVDVEGVRIVLDSGGASVAGVVLDPQGQPLPGAQVLLGNEDAFEQMTLENGQQARPPAAQFATADEVGRFEFAGAPVGKLGVKARSKGLAPWKGEVETVEGVRAELVIRLQKGVKLHGRACDSQGAPLKVAIEANGGYGFSQRYRTSAADGSFVVTGLPTGEFEVKASADGLVDAHTTLIGTPGADLVWNPVLGGGLKISGRLVGKDIDFSKWWMFCESEDWQKAPYNQSVTPKADGSFEFSGCGDAQHKIRVHAADAALFPVVHFEARPGGEPLLIPVDASMVPTCRVRGRILDDAGKPVAGAEFNLLRTGLNFSPIESADLAGRFDLGPLPPGEYSVISRAAGFCPLHSAAIALEANANWDFGDLQLVRGGTLLMHLAQPTTREVTVELRRGGSEQWVRVKGDRGHSEAFEPGEYELHVWVDGREVELPGVVRVTVRAGEESLVELALP